MSERNCNKFFSDFYCIRTFDYSRRFEYNYGRNSKEAAICEIGSIT